jgi:hypothetical protein
MSRSLLTASGATPTALTRRSSAAGSLAPVNSSSLGGKEGGGGEGETIRHCC